MRGFHALVKRWDKCINVDGGYVEKWMFIPGSNITYFTFYINLWHVYWLLFVYTVTFNTFMLAVYPTSFNVYNVIFRVVYIFMPQTISSRLLSVVAHAFECFRCLKLFLSRISFYISTSYIKMWLYIIRLIYWVYNVLAYVSSRILRFLYAIQPLGRKNVNDCCWAEWTLEVFVIFFFQNIKQTNEW
jgi:hypothetical protein